VYLAYYGLNEPPFDLTPNPRFLFYSAKHREAFNHLLYGVRERKGFVQLTGEVGAGKTTLCRAVLEALDTHCATALILNPVLDADQLLKAIADAGASRMEPIILTKLCTVLGLLPITLSDPLWRGLGGAIISGILLASSIMLLFIPVVYYDWMKSERK
jgi:general secretion pathway protein A